MPEGLTLTAEHWTISEILILSNQQKIVIKTPFHISELPVRCNTGIQPLSHNSNTSISSNPNSTGCAKKRGHMFDCTYEHKNCPFLWGNLNPHLIRGSLSLFGIHHSKLHPDLIGRFSTAYQTDRQTNGRTDGHGTRPVSIGHLRYTA